MKRVDTLCTGCGAPLAGLDQLIIACDYCGAAYLNPHHVSTAHQTTSPPQIGDLLLAADFTDPVLPGWVRYNTEKTEIRQVAGRPPELWGAFPEENSYLTLLSTAGAVDDCDISVNIRFINGIWDQTRAGIELRHDSEVGDYLIAISPQGTFCIGYHIADKWGDYLQNWSEHPALKSGWEVTNRLRVRHQGDQLRVYLNGVLAASVRDSRYVAAGRILIAGAPIEGDATIAISQVQLRDV